MRILLLDIETAPNTVHVWGLWDQNINLSHVMESSYVLCWSAKWLGERELMFSSMHKDTAKQMLTKIHTLLNQADAVVHFNGEKFDIPTLNKEFILHKMPPPAPYKQIDLLKLVKSKFKFLSNKLDFIAKSLGVGEKTKYISHTLWVRCMEGDEDAWEQMEHYNKNDVTIMEKVYQRLLPWMKSHANFSLHQTAGLVCPNCGKAKYQRRGYAFTQLGKYQRYQCKSCATWFRGVKKETLSGIKAVAL